MEGLRPHDERRAHRIQREFLKVITRLLGEDLVDHERLVAPPGRLELPGGGEPQLGLTVHDPSLTRRALYLRCAIMLFFFGWEEGGREAEGGEVGYRYLCGFSPCDRGAVHAFGQCIVRLSLRPAGVMGGSIRARRHGGNQVSATCAHRLCYINHP